jgi:hypothetical protein
MVRPNEDDPGMSEMANETDIPELLGLRSEVATVIAELRTHPLDELPTAAARLEASAMRPLDDLLAGRATEERPALAGC